MLWLLLGTLVYFRYIPTTVLDGVGEGPCVTGGAVWCILSDLLQGCELSAIPRCQEPGQVLLQPLASASNVFAWALAASSLKILGVIQYSFLWVPGDPCPPLLFGKSLGFSWPIPGCPSMLQVQACVRVCPEQKHS